MDEAVKDAKRDRVAVALLPEQVAIGLVTAVAVSLLDAAETALGEHTLEASALDVFLGAFHLLALYLPAGLLLGILSSAVLALLRWLDALTGLRRRLGDPRRWVRPNAATMSAVLGVLVGVLVLGVGTRWAHSLLMARIHRVDLMAWALAGATVGLAAIAYALGSVAAALVRPVLRVSKLAATPLSWLLLLGVSATYVGIRELAREETLVTALGWGPILFGPAVALLYVLSFVGVRTLFARRRVGGRRAYALLGVATLSTVTLFVVSGLTYGDRNRVRHLVEQRSVGGRFLVRRYAGLTDLDHDGHAWAFGGRDCDDFDPDVHPGALDVPGDGVDSDCFYGDGSPSIHDAGDGRYGALPPETPPRPNILLITVDALRPDHLGVAGYQHQDISPRLDRLAREGVRFESVVAQSSRSIRSIPSMMTGRYPSQIAYGDEYLFPSLEDENHTVAEVLRDHGYQTAAVMGTDYFQRASGFFQGFDEVDQLDVYKPPRNVTVDRAITQLDRLASGEPFFQWVHLFHVHQPYLDPPTRSLYGDGIVASYDTEITLCDAEVGRLLDELDRLGVADDTVVVLASDHGEAFTEHGRYYHSTDLYEEQVQSALIIRAPGVEPSVIEGTVALFDVGVTLLNFARVPVPEPTPARSLVPLLTGAERPDPERVVLSELMPDGKYPLDVKSLRIGNRKLIWWVQEGTVQYFDLGIDPRETRDLSDEREADALEMLGLLQAWVAETNRPENRNTTFVEEHRLAEAPTSYDHPLDLRYPGLFTVLGCDLPRHTYRIGDTIDLVCYYRVEAPTDLDLLFRLSFTGPPGWVPPRDFHGQHYPLHGRYRTRQWQPGEVLADPTPIVVPAGLQVPLEVQLTLDVEPTGRSPLTFEHDHVSGQTATIATIQLIE